MHCLYNMYDSKLATAPQEEIHLQKIAQHFMAGLQRHFDALSFNLASRQSARQELYEHFSNAPRVMPSGPAHQNFKQIAHYTRDLLTRQILAESINLAVTALNNAHFFLSLVQAAGAGAGREASPEVQEVAQASQRAFVALPLEEKFNQLEKDYGVMCELEDTILAMGQAMNALLYQEGQLAPEQFGEDGKLVIELKALGIDRAGDVNQPGQGKLVDRRLEFVEGDAVELGDAELQLVMITIAAFANSLFKSVERFSHAARAAGGAH